MKRYFLSLGLLSLAASADPNPNLYPFSPYSITTIRSHVVNVTEDQAPVLNIFEIDRRQLHTGRAR